MTLRGTRGARTTVLGDGLRWKVGTMRVRRMMLLLVVSLAACGAPKPLSKASPAATSTPASSTTASEAALAAGDLGGGWKTYEPSANAPVIRIGNRIGVDNIPYRVASREQVAYEQGSAADSGFVGNTILVMGGDEDAKKVLADYRAAGETTTWKQSFGDTDDELFLEKRELEQVGDETLAFTVVDTAKDRKTGAEDSATFEYVVFRIGKVVSVLVVSNTEVLPAARKSAERVRRAAA